MSRSTIRTKQHNAGDDVVAEGGKLHRLATHYQQQGETLKAIAVLQDLIHLNPQDVAAHANLGLMHHTAGDPQQAADCYQQALALDDQQYHLHFLLGSAWKDMGLLDEAVSALKEALRLAPTDAGILHELAAVYRCRNSMENAAACYHSILQHSPKDHQALVNLGLLSFRQKKFQEALHFYSQAAVNNPDDADILFNLALTHRQTGDHDQALACCKKALAIQPDDADIHFCLGSIYRDLHDLDRSIACFKHVVAVDPQHGAAFNNLGNLFHLQGNIDEAILCYKKSVELDHHAESAGHLLAALTGEQRNRAPSQYVIDLFDNYAERFDPSLVQDLEYRVPGLLRRLLDRHRLRARSFASGLDLGCGTGLAALPFLSTVRKIAGVDLSGKMLAKAAARGIYHSLYQAELLDFLKATRECFDLIIAADVLTYLGDLDPLFQATARRLCHDGLWLLSTEHHQGSTNYTLQPSGRFGHTIAYIERLAARHNLTIARREQQAIRKDKEQWITGDLYLLTNYGKEGKI
jgi:predicted TPR repeat methyltransferase